METRQAIYEVELYLGYLRMTGVLSAMPARRLSDFLNDSHNPHITLDQASVLATRHGSQDAAVKVPTSMVFKEQVELVRLISDEQRARIALVQTDAVVRKVQYPVVFFLPNYLVRGKMHLIPGAALQDSLSRLQYDFVPLTDAAVIPVHAEAPQDRQRSFVIVNRRHIMAVYSEGSD